MQTAALIALENIWEADVASATDFHPIWNHIQKHILCLQHHMLHIHNR